MKMVLILLCWACWLPVISFADGARFLLESASETALSNPHDIRLTPDKRYLLVSDVGNDRVVALDPETLAFVDAFGDAELDGVHDLDFDSDGRLYAADTHNGRVAVYTMNGSRGVFSGELKGDMSGPEGVLVHPNGRVYVAGAWSNNVVVYEAGRVVDQLRGLSAPHDLALAPDGRIWVADAGNDRLLLLTPELEIVSELSGPDYGFDGVRYLDLLDDGTLLAADKYTHSVKVIDHRGRLTSVLGDGEPGRSDQRLRTPEGVEVDGRTVWIADSGNNRILRYRLLAY